MTNSSAELKVADIATHATTKPISVSGQLGIVGKISSSIAADTVEMRATDQTGIRCTILSIGRTAIAQPTNVAMNPVAAKNHVQSLLQRPGRRKRAATIAAGRNIAMSARVATVGMPNACVNRQAATTAPPGKKPLPGGSG